MWDFRFITLHGYHIQYKLIAGYMSECFSRISDLLRAAQQRLERRATSERRYKEHENNEDARLSKYHKNINSG